MLLDG